MTADSNTPFGGQEPGPQYRNPYPLPAYQGPFPPPEAPRKTRFSAAAITGMILVTILWALLFFPLSTFFFSTGGFYSFSIYNLFILAGPITLFGGVAGFFVALSQGNRKRAARLYIIPSLIWQGAILAAIVLFVISVFVYGVS